MMHLNRFGVAILAAAFLCGCQIQHTTVLDTSATANLAANGAQPAPRPSARVVLQSPCSEPRSAGPVEHLPSPVSFTKLQPPPQAMAAHVSGCAGVKFRIGSNGQPQDMTLMAEYPLRYGFGARGIAQVHNMRWAPQDDMAWRYLVINMRAPT